jgi:hypothetical protein
MSSGAVLIWSSRFRGAALVTTLCGCVASTGQFELGSVPGLYQVVYWGAHRSWRSPRYLGALFPTELRVSNAFRVVE